MRQAQWLSSKFHHRRAKTAGEASTTKRNGNTYPVVEAKPPTASMATGISQDGTDYSYFVKARVGSKGKELYLLLDTGAGSSWVMGSTCTDQPCTMHNTFGPGDSNTYTDNQKPFSISYGTGKVEGNLVTDTISVAGISVKYSFGLASKASDDFTRFAFDGILGMSMSLGSGDNFLKRLADDKKLDKNLFGVALNRASDGTSGEIRIGATNPDKYTGPIGYTPLGTKDGDWSIPIDDMTYDGKKAGCGGVLAYLDTGTSFIFGPADLVKKLHAVIPGSASVDKFSYRVPCDSNKVLTFTFSGVEYKLSPKDWIAPKDDSGQCTSNIYAREVVAGAWLLGDAFLKNVYTIFDKDQQRIGLAVTAGAQSSSSASASPSASTGTGTGTSSSGTPGQSASGSTMISTSLPTSSAVVSQSTSSSGGIKPPLGLNGHETGGGPSATGSAAKPSKTSDSSATPLKARKQAIIALFALASTFIAMLS